LNQIIIQRRCIILAIQGPAAPQTKQPVAATPPTRNTEPHLALAWHLHSSSSSQLSECCSSGVACLLLDDDVLSHASHLPLNSLMARNRAFHRIALRGVSCVNLSRRPHLLDGWDSHAAHGPAHTALCVLCASIPTRQVPLARCCVLEECVHSDEKAPEKGGSTELKIGGGKEPEI
jgi:hypothetical protein